MNALRGLAIVVICFQAWLLVIAGDRSFLPLITIALAIVGSYRLDQWKIRPTTLWLGLLLGIVYVIYLTILRVYGSVVVSTWSLCTFPLAYVTLVAEVLLLFTPHASWQLVRSIPAMLIAFLGLVFSQSTLPGMPGTTLSLAILGLCLAAILPAASWKRIDLRGELRRWGILAGTMACAALASSYILKGLQNIPRPDHWLTETLSAQLAPRTIARQFVRNATLSSIAEQQRENPRDIVLTVECEIQPGYLRGAAYDTTDGYRWVVKSQRSLSRRKRYEASTLMDPLEELPLAVPFAANDPVFGTPITSRPSWVKVGVTNDASRGRMFFLPLQTAYMQGSGLQLLVNEHLIVERGFDVRKPYYAYVGSQVRSPPPTDTERETMLENPSDLRPLLDSLATRVFKEQQNISEKLEAVEQYFRANYYYSLEGFPVPKDKSALGYFLETKPAAHCEFFASASALLLRTQGIPTRYVTGYVVSEEDEGKWVARNRHAHAWVEAFDQTQSRWCIVESTPGFNIPKEFNPTRNEASSTGGEGATDGEEQDSIWGWDWNLNFAGLNILRSLGTIVRNAALLTLAVGGVLGIWMLRRRWLEQTSADRRRANFHVALQRMDRAAKRRKLVRQAGETLHQFAQRIAAAGGQDAWCAPAADWYLRYATAVYGSQAESPPEPIA